MNLSLNQKLAFSAFSLSLLALIVGAVFPSDHSQKSVSDIEYISVLELATEIKNKESMLLFDLRTDSSFNAFHIPTSSNKSLPQLLKQEISPTTKTVLYSQSNEISEQAYYMLKGKGLNHVYVLKGGVEDWYDRILYPKMPKVISESDEEIASQVKSLSAYFGGRSVFVDEGSPLDYYRGINELSESKTTSKLVRMGC